MLTKHFLQRAYMNHRQDENMLTDIMTIPVQLVYAIGWDFWHENSLVSSLDSGKIGVQNFWYYKKHKMIFKDRKKASRITLAIYQAMIKSNLFTNVSKDKQYYSMIYDRYYENIDLARVLVQIHSEEDLKNQQEICINFDANEAKLIETDQYMTILNQCLARIDDNLTVLNPTIEENGWYVYKIKDNSVNYRINLADFKCNRDDFKILLDGGHTWNLAKAYGALISGASGTGKTSLLYSMIYQLLQKKNVEIYVADGKNDQLGAVMLQILPGDHVATGVESAELVHKLVIRSDNRYKHMSTERKKNSQLAFANFDKFNYKMIVIFIDEQSAITASLSDSKARKQYQNDLLKLVQTSRASGIIPVVSMQQANAQSFGGTLGTAIREQLQGLKVIMGTVNTITTQDKQMIFNASVELPFTKSNDVGVGYLQTADMQAPEVFEAPLLPRKSEELYKLLQRK